MLDADADDLRDDLSGLPLLSKMGELEVRWGSGRRGGASEGVWDLGDGSGEALGEVRGKGIEVVFSFKPPPRNLMGGGAFSSSLSSLEFELLLSCNWNLADVRRGRAARGANAPGPRSLVYERRWPGLVGGAGEVVVVVLVADGAKKGIVVAKNQALTLGFVL